MASLDINIDPYRVISISDLNLKSRSITGCSWSRKETTTWLLAHVGGCFSGRNSLRESYDGAKLVQWLLRVTYTLAWRKRGISKMLRAGLNANGGHVVFFFFLWNAACHAATYNCSFQTPCWCITVLHATHGAWLKRFEPQQRVRV